VPLKRARLFNVKELEVAMLRINLESIQGLRRRVDGPMLALLKAAVAARLNIVISGGTGAGKTTLLNVLSGYISPKERIVTK